MFSRLDIKIVYYFEDCKIRMSELSNLSKYETYKQDKK